MVNSFTTVAEAVGILPGLTAKVKKQAQEIADSASYAISPGFSPGFSPGILPEDVIEWIKGIRGMEVPKGTNIHSDFFGKDLLNATDPRIPNNIKEIKENGIELTKSLGNHLGIELPEEALFNSPGAITRINGEGIIDGSFHNFEDLFSEVTLSDVFQSYNCDPNFFLDLSFKKASLTHLVNSANPNIKKGLLMPTSVIQKSIEDNMGIRQYRGGAGMMSPIGVISTSGTSGSSLNEKVVAAIVTKLLGGTMEEYTTKHGIKRCDVLAGLGDELLGKLIGGISPEFAISEFAKDIEKCMAEGTMDTLN